MATSESGRYEARMKKRRGDVELQLDLGEGRREAIMKCLEKGDLRMVLQDVDLDRLAASDLGGGYLWD
jgi:hypothetical protein